VKPSAFIPAQAGIHNHDASRKGGTVCASSCPVSGYGSRAPLTRPRDDTRASSLPLVGRARVGVLAPHLHRLSLTPPPPPPPHKGEESPSRQALLTCARGHPFQTSLRWTGRRARRAACAGRTHPGRVREGRPSTAITSRRLASQGLRPYLA
jgi:hypothetical protein